MVCVCGVCVCGRKPTLGVGLKAAAAEEKKKGARKGGKGADEEEKVVAKDKPVAAGGAGEESSPKKVKEKKEKKKEEIAKPVDEHLSKSLAGLARENAADRTDHVYHKWEGPEAEFVKENKCIKKQTLSIKCLLLVLCVFLVSVLACFGQSPAIDHLNNDASFICCPVVHCLLCVCLCAVSATSRTRCVK